MNKLAGLFLSGWVILYSINSAFAEEQEQVSTPHQYVMQTALISLVHKAQNEEKLNPPSQYSREIINHLSQSSLTAEQYKRIAADSHASAYTTNCSLAFDTMLSKVLATFSEPPPLIALAAGFDTRPLRFSSSLSEIYEIDLPDMIEKKRKVYDALDLGAEHHLISADVTKPEWLEQVPRSGVIISIEGLLPYLDEEQARTVILQIAQNFHHSHILVETLPDYMIPTSRPGITGAFIRWVMSRKPDAREAISMFRSSGEFLMPENIDQWTQKLPLNQLVYRSHLNPLITAMTWKLQLLWYLGLDTPKVTWLTVN